VFLYGKSWGGFNALQIAARNPRHLTGIITLFSTGTSRDCTTLVTERGNTDSAMVQ
jgi:predicted acyl esterase